MKVQIKAFHGKLSILEQNQDEILNTYIVCKNKEVNLCPYIGGMCMYHTSLATLTLIIWFSKMLIKFSIFFQIIFNNERC
jgi:hypothetical protein